MAAEASPPSEQGAPIETAGISQPVENAAINGERADAPASDRRRSALWPALGLVTLPIIALDQASKYWIVEHLQQLEMITIVPHWLDLTYTLNPGAAFSLFANLPTSLRTAFLAAISGFAIIVLTILLIRSRSVSVQTIALAMILGGAAGNLADRIVRGRVVDFIYVHYYRLSYPVFNLADSAITIGVGVILLGMLTDKGPQASANYPRERNEPRD